MPSNYWQYFRFIRSKNVLLLIVSLMTFTAGITTISVIDRDEARFAQASKQMLISNDFVTPRFQEELRAKKPIGIYGMQSASAYVFGQDKIASYRLPSTIGAIITVLLTTYLARQFVGGRAAIFAGLAIATSLVMVAESHLAKTDSMLTAFILMMQVMLWKIYSIHGKNEYVAGKYVLGFWVAMAIAILIKGPIAPVIAFSTIVVITLIQWWRSEKYSEWLISLRPILGIIVLSSIILPWVVMVSSATNGEFLRTAWHGDLVSKITSVQETHGAPPLTYLALIIFTFWPCSFFLARGIKAFSAYWRQPGFLFLMGWLIPFWLILEVTPTKLPHYNLPLFAVLAIIVSLAVQVNMTLPYADTKINIMKRIAVLGWEWLFIIITPMLGVAILYLATFAGGSRLFAFFSLLATLGVSCAAIWWQLSGKNRAIWTMLAGAVLFHVITFGYVLPTLTAIQIAPRIKAEIQNISPQPGIIAAAGYHEPSLVFELGTDTLLFSPQEAAIFLAEAERGLALIEERALPEFLKVANILKIKPQRIKTLEGFNISRGSNVKINFYRLPSLDESNSLQ